MCTENKPIEAVDAAWMNLIGMVVQKPSSVRLQTVYNEDLKLAFLRVEETRARAGLLPLEKIAYALNPVFH